MKNHEKILPQINLRCLHIIHILSNNVKKKNRFFEVDKVDWSLKFDLKIEFEIDITPIGMIAWD